MKVSSGGRFALTAKLCLALLPALLLGGCYIKGNAEVVRPQDAMQAPLADGSYCTIPEDGSAPGPERCRELAWDQGSASYLVDGVPWRVMSFVKNTWIAQRRLEGEDFGYEYAIFEPMEAALRVKLFDVGHADYFALELGLESYIEGSGSGFYDSQNDTNVLPSANREELLAYLKELVGFAEHRDYELRRFDRPAAVVAAGAGGTADRPAGDLVDMAYNYETGNGVAENLTLASELYREAANQGNAEAQYRLGHMYYSGRGVAEDGAEAANWFRKAAEQGDAISQFYLGYLYQHGNGLPQDSALAAQWYRKAAEQGDAEAQHNLGILYRLGEGVGPDYEEAAQWFQLAAAQGIAMSQFQLGMAYENGRGIEKDFAAAALWYGKAADQGHGNAINNLALLYLDGRGVRQDRLKAIELLNTAAEAGNETARENLKIVLNK